MLPLSLPLSYEGTKGPPWGHCVEVGDTVSSLRTSQGKWGHRVTVSHPKVGDAPAVSHPKVGGTPVVSHPEVGKTPTVSHPKVGDTSVSPQWCPTQSWGHSTVSHPKVGDAPTVSHLKFGTALCPPNGVRPQSWGRPHSVTAQSWGLSQRWECPHIPTMASHPKVGDPSGDPFSASPIADSTVPMGWGRGAPFIFGIKVYFVIKGCWGMPPPRE